MSRRVAGAFFHTRVRTPRISTSSISNSCPGAVIAARTSAMPGRSAGTAPAACAVPFAVSSAVSSAVAVDCRSCTSRLPRDHGGAAARPIAEHGSVRPTRISGCDNGGMSERGPIEYWLSDMDGVLVHEGRPVPGADEFIRRLAASGTPFLVLTNNSIYTRRDLSARLAAAGLAVP